MQTSSEADVALVLWTTDDMILRELIRAKASLVDLRRSLQFLRSSANADPRAYRALPRRLQRLVDLLSVAVDSAGRFETLAPSLKAA